MANLYISEFRTGVSGIGSTYAQIMPQPSLADQVLAIGVASVPSAAFGANTYAVEMHCDGACSFKFGSQAPGAADPVATNANMLMSAGETRRYAVTPGQKVAVIANP